MGCRTPERDLSVGDGEAAQGRQARAKEAKARLRLASCGAAGVGGGAGGDESASAQAGLARTCRHLRAGRPQCRQYAERFAWGFARVKVGRDSRLDTVLLLLTRSCRLTRLERRAPSCGESSWREPRPEAPEPGLWLASKKRNITNIMLYTNST